MKANTALKATALSLFWTRNSILAVQTLPFFTKRKFTRNQGCLPGRTVLQINFTFTVVIFNLQEC